MTLRPVTATVISTARDIPAAVISDMQQIWVMNSITDNTVKSICK